MRILVGPVKLLESTVNTLPPGGRVLCGGGSGHGDGVDLYLPLGPYETGDHPHSDRPSCHSSDLSATMVVDAAL